MTTLEAKEAGVPWCSQCGRFTSQPACGPTHACVWAAWEYSKKVGPAVSGSSPTPLCPTCRSEVVFSMGGREAECPACLRHFKTRIVLDGALPPAPRLELKCPACGEMVDVTKVAEGNFQDLRIFHEPPAHFVYRCTTQWLMTKAILMPAQKQ